MWEGWGRGAFCLHFSQSKNARLLNFYPPPLCLPCTCRSQSYKQRDQMLGVKSSPNVFTSHPRCTQISFYIGVSFFKIANKFQIDWATFDGNFVTENFQKSPNPGRVIYKEANLYFAVAVPGSFM